MPHPPDSISPIVFMLARLFRTHFPYCRIRPAISGLAWHGMLAAICTLFLAFSVSADTAYFRAGQPIATLKNDGSVWLVASAGTGTGHTAGKQVQALKDIIALAPGASHILALDRHGHVWAWGDNQAGQLGLGHTRFQPEPVKLAALADISAIAAGDAHSLALDRQGRVWAWGSDTLGQLGQGKTGAFRYHAAPLQVPRLPAVKAIASGSAHALALDKQGHVWVWGANQLGQTGMTDLRDHAEATRLDKPAKADAIHASGHASVVASPGGTLHTWGERAQIEFMTARIKPPATPPAPVTPVAAATPPSGAKPTVAARKAPTATQPLTPLPAPVPAKPQPAPPEPVVQKPLQPNPAPVPAPAAAPSPARSVTPVDLPVAKPEPLPTPAAQATARIISGRVSLADGFFGQSRGLAGVRFAAKGADCSETDTQGHFVCTVPNGWNGRISPSKRSYRFSPSAYSFQNLAGDLDHQNFSASYEPDQ